MLIPLYEQVGVVFGLLGIVRCIVQPTRFRLFMVYWFICNFVLYSWAAEKMPWLMIHITMPMLILAAIGLEPAVVTCINFVKNLFARCSSPKEAVALNGNDGFLQTVPKGSPRAGVFAHSIAFLRGIVPELF